MSVHRTSDQAGPATLTVYFQQAASPSLAAPPPPPISEDPSQAGQSTTPKPSANERMVTIDMKSQHSDAILNDFMSKTGAVPVTPTPQEVAEMGEVEERRKEAILDREAARKLHEVQRREAAFIAQARDEAAAIKQE